MVLKIVGGLRAPVTSQARADLRGALRADQRPPVPARYSTEYHRMRLLRDY